MNVERKPRLLVAAIILFVFSVSISHGGSTQKDSEQVFTEGLVLKYATRYLETIASRDPIEASLVMGKWLAPKKGAIVWFNDSTKAAWELVTADSNGWFRHQSLQGGYAYFNLVTAKREIWLLQGMGPATIYVNGTPRVGSPYGHKDTWESWEPRFDYACIPIQLEAGANEILCVCNRGSLKLKLIRPASNLILNDRDTTLPDLIASETFEGWGAIVLVHAAATRAKNLVLCANWEGQPAVMTAVPTLLPLSVRKVGFKIKGLAPATPGALPLHLKLIQYDAANLLEVGQTQLTLQVKTARAARQETFISAIDGSVQYYAIYPAQTLSPDRPAALFLSLHGASVEAINQVNSYAPKTWGHIVAPTNRRPYGFNWEDWGRLDALEVLKLVTTKYAIDPARIYLTGHSMGGHGTFHLGVTFPDQFAAIGPSAGWISFWSYRVREKFQNPTPMRELMMRATLPSDTYQLASNLKQAGVYILHGSQDDNVPPDQSRKMAEHLKTFHPDFVYFEQPGAGHWWDNSDESGTDCVDWAPLFDFFARHARPEAERVRQIDFCTANPGVSAQCHWISIEAQQKPLKLSSIQIQVDPGVGRFVGTTQNVERLALDVHALKLSDSLQIILDGQKLPRVPSPASGHKIWLVREREQWCVSAPPTPDLKGPLRYGLFKDAIKNRVLLVYGTQGNTAENKWAFEKARFDAERFWYQGNGSIEIIADVDFNAEIELDRNVVLYGNAATNLAWKPLLADSPVQVQRGLVRVGARTFKGDDLNALFIRPRKGSAVASVGVVSGTGLIGMRLNQKMAYLTPGIAFPDCFVAAAAILLQGEAGIRSLGFFGNDWSIEHGDFLWQSTGIK